MIKNAKYVEIKGASHRLTRTRAEEINAELVPFLGTGHCDTAEAIGRLFGCTPWLSHWKPES